MHRFWSTQPVPQSVEDRREGVLEELPAPRDTPWTLPKGFEWSDLEVGESAETLTEVCGFLRKHYVTDTKVTVRLQYSEDMLKWALCGREQRKGFVFGVRGVAGRRALVAMIAAIPHRVSVRGQVLEAPIITFHCVHPKLRGKRLAPMLMREVSRRVRVAGFKHMVYTTGADLPTPFVSVDCKTTALTKEVVEVAPCLRSNYRIRPTRLGDLGQVEQLHLNEQMKDRAVRPEFGCYEDVVRNFMPGQEVMTSMVVTPKSNSDRVVAFFTMHRVDVKPCGGGEDETIKHAFLGYLGFDPESFTSLSDLVQLVRHISQVLGYHALSAYDMGNRGPALEANGFEDGDAKSHYHLYNFGAPGLTHKDVELFII